jgi:glycosyltransferase involved in cell wall biosynthesis
MFKNYVYNDREIIYSIVIPVYNQETIFVNNLQSIINNTQDTFEIIIILDYCFDNTEKYLLDFLNNYTNNNSNLIEISIFKNSDKPLFETKCDNIGFKNSKGKFCLEIQADMEMTELGYNIQLTKPFYMLDNVIAVSGRCTHNLFDDDGVGKLGGNIEKNNNTLNVDKNCFYVFETCNRGPLLLDRTKLKEMNFLNEDEYFLDNSDHDLMARAFLEKKYICGYVPIEFNAPLCNGSTRKNKHIYCNESLINEQEKARLTQLCNTKPRINKYRNIWKKKPPVIYTLCNYTK